MGITTVAASDAKPHLVSGRKCASSRRKPISTTQGRLVCRGQGRISPSYPGDQAKTTCVTVR